VVTTRCDQVARVVGSTLLQLGPLVIGRVEHFRTVECGLARARFVATPEFVQWAAAYGVQWYATSLVLVPTFSFGRPVYLADGFRGPSFGFGPTDLWSVPVTGIGRSCSSAMASLVLVHNGQALPATNALTSVVCG